MIKKKIPVRNTISEVFIRDADAIVFLAFLDLTLNLVIFSKIS